MKSYIFGLIFTVVLVATAQPVLAQNKVVVIPLNDNSVPLRIFYGSVRGAGSLETGNIVSADRTSTGRYTLEFGENVAGCAVTVSKGVQGGGSANVYGNVTVNVASNGTTVTVNTRDDSGGLDDTDFHFTAICPKL